MTAVKGGGYRAWHLACQLVCRYAEDLLQHELGAQQLQTSETALPCKMASRSCDRPAAADCTMSLRIGVTLQICNAGPLPA